MPDLQSRISWPSEPGIDLVDNAGNTPLTYWCIEGIGEYYFKALNYQNNEGKNALHYAVKSAKRTLIQNLLDHGVDCNIKDNSGKTAMDYARELKRFDICELMENYKHKNIKGS